MAYLIYEDNKLIGVADDARKAGKLIEAQLNGCSERGYFGNEGTKGLYKLGGHTYPGTSIKGIVYEYESSSEDDPTYRIIPFELNTLFPGYDRLPSTYYNP